jgi:hypothetical protein
MRRKSWCLLAVGAAALGVFTTARAASPRPGPAFDPSMVWEYYTGTAAGDAHLNYQTADTDNVGILFQCRSKAGTIRFVTDVDKGAAGPGVVRFQSGKIKGRYAARLQSSELTGGWVASGEIPLRDSTLAAFEKTGRISLVEERVYPQNARTAAERTAIRHFFDACRG